MRGEIGVLQLSFSVNCPGMLAYATPYCNLMILECTRLIYSEEHDLAVGVALSCISLWFQFCRRAICFLLKSTTLV